MDIDNFEWWYSEGEAPDEEWDEPAPRDVSSDEDETGNDAAVEPDAASDAATRKVRQSPCKKTKSRKRTPKHQRIKPFRQRR